MGKCKEGYMTKDRCCSRKTYSNPQKAKLSYLFESSVMSRGLGILLNLGERNADGTRLAPCSKGSCSLYQPHRIVSILNVIRDRVGGNDKKA